MRKLLLVTESKVRPRPNREPATTVHRVLSVAAQALVEAYRSYGYLLADINPLEPGADEDLSIPELNPDAYGLSADESVSHAIEFGGALHTLTRADLQDRLHETYCGPIALDCAHIRASNERRWLHLQMETMNAWTPLSAEHGAGILRELVAAEAFEQFQRKQYPEHKQFSLEGSESFVPLLNAVIECAAQRGIEDIVLGMPHRGRLNVLANVFDLPMPKLLSLFTGQPDRTLAAWDLKDHLGYATQKRTGHGTVSMALAHNPSHLGSVAPVVCGMARAMQDRKTGGSSRKVMPVLIHGDATFSAQGVVAETLNLSKTRGFSVGGTLHLILNNQIGSTISYPGDARSTLHCADYGRGIDAPIIHVNGDDPEATILAAKLATGYRMTFGADVVINHISYRRHGHFGGDDPKMTQPAMQRRIRSHPSVACLYADELVRAGLARDGDLERMKRAAFDAMTGAVVAAAMPADEPAGNIAPAPAPKSPVSTAVPLRQLQAILNGLTQLPPDVVLHADVQKMLENWRSVANGEAQDVDWCLAENLAFGTLLANGFNVRLTGLDVGRGSFFHRQHVWHDQKTDLDGYNIHVPLRHVAGEQGYFSIFESPLSEEAVLGFEYGYTLRCGRDLVVWEAQFGDFVNNAQVIIDQFIASGERKWGYTSGLVMLLPHGYEGGGPEHSCAYLGRFLQLCAEDNLQVAMPSTAAQQYHLLRRQALLGARKPLIVLTPKGWLYANRTSHSHVHDLTHGGFAPVVGETVAMDGGAIKRAVVASGKFYYDLLSERTRARLSNVPILRLEMLYPFPAVELEREFKRYPGLQEVVWAQEETKNHGAWYLLRDALEAALPPGVSLAYAGRPAAAPTAACNRQGHAAEQREIAHAALRIALI